jgi:hypothetical protein
MAQLPDKRTRRFNKVPSKSLIEDRLYWRIRGYEYKEVTEELREVEEIDRATGAEVIVGKMVTTKIVHKSVAPDVGAIIFAAKNIIPEKYKDKSDLNLGVTDDLAALLTEARNRTKPD